MCYPRGSSPPREEMVIVRQGGILEVLDPRVKRMTKPKEITMKQAELEKLKGKNKDKDIELEKLKGQNMDKILKLIDAGYTKAEINKMFGW